MISLILIILAGIFNACMDNVSFRWNNSTFNKFNAQWFNPVLSSQNKWKYNENGIWNGEKFFGSSTFLVFLTDFWHFCKFIMLLLIVAGIVFYKPLINWWVDLLILYCAFTVTFELFFSKILITHKNI